MGLSHTTLEDETLALDLREINPKLGLRWKVAPTHELRFTANRGVKRVAAADLMLEPAVLSGFTQLHDDFAGTRYDNVGIAYGREHDSRTLSGVELVHRELDVPALKRNFSAPENDRFFTESQRETVFRGYWNRIVRDDLSLGLTLQYERAEREDSRNEAGDPEFLANPFANRDTFTSFGVELYSPFRLLRAEHYRPCLSISRARSIFLFPAKKRRSTR